MGDGLIPIIGFPGVVKEFAGWFRQVLSHHQLRRFKQYLSGLITGVKPTIRRMASRLVDRVDQSSLNRFLTLYEWDEERVIRMCRSRAYRRVQSDQTIGAGCRQAFMDLVQNLIRWIYKMPTKYQSKKY